MTRLTIITDKLEGMSIDLIAESLCSAAMLRGINTEVVRAGKSHGQSVHQAHVISLLPIELGRYAPAFRFVRPLSFTTVIASNWEEREVPDQMKLMAYHLDPKLSGVPVQLIAHSHHTLRAVTGTARSLLSPSACRSFLSQFKTVLYGIEDGFEPGENDPGSLVVPYNRINNTQKRADLHAKLTLQYQVLASNRGHQVSSTFYRSPTDPSNGLSDLDIEAVHSTVPQPATRDEFRANARKHGMFLCTSIFESFGGYYLELLASGVVGVFAEAPWIKSLLPGYRYVAKTQDLPALMLHVRENYDEARRYILDEIRPDILKRYSIARFNAELLALAQGGA